MVRMVDAMGVGTIYDNMVYFYNMLAEMFGWDSTDAPNGQGNFLTNSLGGWGDEAAAVTAGTAAAYYTDSNLAGATTAFAAWDAADGELSLAGSFAAAHSGGWIGGTAFEQGTENLIGKGYISQTVGALATAGCMVGSFLWADDVAKATMAPAAPAPVPG